VIEYLIGGVVMVFLVALIVGGLTGRVRARGRCSVADPSQDPRMRESRGEGT
jgi:hypothetical protein